MEQFNILFERENEKIASMGNNYVVKRLKTFNDFTLNTINSLRKEINVIDIDGSKNEEEVSNDVWNKFNEINKIGKFSNLI